MSYKLKLIEAETNDNLKEYESDIVPNVGDEIEIKQNTFLYISHRVFNSTKNNIIKLYGIVDTDCEKCNKANDISKTCVCFQN